MPPRRQITLVLAVLVAWYWQKHIIRGPVFTGLKDLRGMTVLITGGNAGIGKASAMEFAKMGARVVIASRNVGKSKKARNEIIKESGNENVAVFALDLENFDSVRSFAKKFQESKDNLDILVNNAGVLGVRGTTSDGYNRMSVINYFGPFLLTNLLLDKMKAQSTKRPIRIINVSSDAYVFYSELVLEKFRQDATNMLEDFSLYGHTNLATFLFTQQLHRQLKDYDISTYVVHPGTIRSELGGDLTGFRLMEMLFLPFTRSTYYGAQTILYCALEDDVTNYSGDYFADCTRQELAAHAKNESVAKRLWKESLKITKLD